MTTWIILNSVLRLVLAFILTFKLVAFYDNFKPTERVGMGLMGGSAILTLAPIWTNGPTPFDDWSTFVFTLGAVVYFVGRLTRHRRHNRANDLMIAQARAHREGRK